MADIIRERETNGSNLLSWVAIVLAAAAMFLAVSAYNRSGENIDDRVRRIINDSSQNIQEQTDNASDEASQGVDGVEDAIDAGPDGVDDGNR